MTALDVGARLRLVAYGDAHLMIRKLTLGDDGAAATHLVTSVVNAQRAGIDPEYVVALCMALATEAAASILERQHGDQSAIRRYLQSRYDIELLASREREFDEGGA